MFDGFPVGVGGLGILCTQVRKLSVLYRLRVAVSLWKEGALDSAEEGPRRRLRLAHSV
jgi:hypothetical protein